MEYKYSIAGTNLLEKWIYIQSGNECDCEDADAFVYLLKEISRKIDGKIISIGDMQYKIINDQIDLIYQWDGCFGITVIYPTNVTLNIVLDYLNRYMPT